MALTLIDPCRARRVAFITSRRSSRALPGPTLSSPAPLSPLPGPPLPAPPPLSPAPLSPRPDSLLPALEPFSLLPSPPLSPSGRPADDQIIPPLAISLWFAANDNSGRRGPDGWDGWMSVVPGASEGVVQAKGPSYRGAAWRCSRQGLACDSLVTFFCPPRWFLYLPNY